MTSRVPPTDAHVRRVQAEAASADTMRKLCTPELTGVPVSELAENYLGIARSKLYESFEPGQRTPRLAWVELLPAQAELSYLRQRAQRHQYDVVPAEREHACLADVVGEAGRVLAALAGTEADGHISPAEAATDIAAIERLEQMLARAKSARRQAIEERGLRIVGKR